MRATRFPSFSPASLPFLRYVWPTVSGCDDIGYRLRGCIGSVTAITRLCDRVTKYATVIAAGIFLLPAERRTQPCRQNPPQKRLFSRFGPTSQSIPLAGEDLIGWGAGPQYYKHPGEQNDSTVESVGVGRSYCVCTIARQTGFR